MDLSAAQPQCDSIAAPLLNDSDSSDLPSEGSNSTIFTQSDGSGRSDLYSDDSIPDDKPKLSHRTKSCESLDSDPGYIEPIESNASPLEYYHECVLILTQL
jgi:hypothetical protein